MIQIEHFGKHSLENIVNIIAIHNAKKILLVTGKKSFEKSGSEEKLLHFLKNVT
jgi:alcohol dehydrogenase YqhD (iron-dependent ADH family)